MYYLTVRELLLMQCEISEQRFVSDLILWLLMCDDEPLKVALHAFWTQSHVDHTEGRQLTLKHTNTMQSLTQKIFYVFVRNKIELEVWVDSYWAVLALNYATTGVRSLTKFSLQYV